MRNLIALAIATGSAASVQEPPKVDETVTGRYQFSNGSSIEALGGCRIGVPDSVACWNMAGTPDDDLSKKVKATLLSSGQDIQFRFGREIKCIVFRRARNVNLSYQTGNGNSINLMHLQRDSDASQYDLLFPRDEGDLRSMDVVATIFNAEKPVSVDVPFRKGERVKIGNAEFEIGAAVPMKAPKPTQPPGGNFNRWTGGFPSPPFNGSFFLDSKLWLLGVGYQKPEDRGQFNGFAAIDKSDRIIYYTDKHGEPISATQVVAEEPPPPPYMMYQQDPNAKPPKFRQALIVPSGIDANGAYGYAMNINPERIAKFRFFGQSNRAIRFKGIPLDVQNP